VQLGWLEPILSAWRAAARAPLAKCPECLAKGRVERGWWVPHLGVYRANCLREWQVHTLCKRREMVVETQGGLGPEWAGASVSWGTLKLEDLIPAFVDVLAEVDVARAAEYQREFDLWQERLNEESEFTEEECQEQLSYICDELIDLLGGIAPDGCVFGTNEGDGSDFGFWMIEGSDES